ncbi:MAG: hypothetical protein NZ455_07125 [Bacteroidia bacterium]|nr:hypothetical protein [Bacteroidia bacterium]MDW8346404.1 hypothetical protein [Bacteroidia bacterium]
MPLGSAEQSAAPSVSVVRNSPTRSAAKGHAQKRKLFFRLKKSLINRYSLKVKTDFTYICIRICEYRLPCLLL